MLVVKSVSTQIRKLSFFPSLLRIRGFEVTGPFSQTKYQLSTNRKTREFKKILRAEVIMEPLNLSEINIQLRETYMVQPEGDLSVDTTLSSNRDYHIESNNVLFVPSNSMSPENFDVVTEIEDDDFLSIGLFEELCLETAVDGLFHSLSRI